MHAAMSRAGPIRSYSYATQCHVPYDVCKRAALQVLMRNVVPLPGQGVVGEQLEHRVGNSIMI